MIAKTHGNQRGTLEAHEMLAVMASWQWLPAPRASLLMNRGHRYFVHTDGRRRSTDWHAWNRHYYDCASGKEDASAWREVTLYDAASVANSILAREGGHCSICRHHFTDLHARFSDAAYRRIICVTCGEMADGALRNDKACIEGMIARPAVATEARAALRRLKAHGNLSADAQRDLGRIERLVGFRQRKEPRP